MANKLTGTEKRFLSYLKQGKRCSKLGHKFYISNHQFITKQFKLSTNAFDKLVQLGLVRKGSGGKIELISSK